MFKILLSPAKSISKEPISYGTPSQPVLENKSARLVELLKKYTPKELSSLMSISPSLADLNWSRYQNWKPLSESSNVIQPALAFTGEVYKGLDAVSFSETEWNRAQASLRILSGLYGFLKPLDGISPYRLEMGTRLKVDDLSNNLYEYWKKDLADSFKTELSKSDVIINLASVEYSKVLNFKSIENLMITPVFKDFKNGKLKTIMMYAKRARGSMARSIIQKNIQHIDELKTLDVDGYIYAEELSDEFNWVFRR
jgi:hypothetical protein|tara:strand:+ start:3640 stop:4401 length:762 start_codon:yes stop_codon:yes gene_type:complete